jgi:hypothetical protein
MTLTTQPCTATCVIDGQAVKLQFSPGTGVLRISDASGGCLREIRWYASWRALMASFRDFSQSTLDAGTGVERLFAYFSADPQRDAHVHVHAALA